VIFWYKINFKNPNFEFRNNDQNSSAKLKTQKAPKESLRLPTGQAKLQLKAKSETFALYALSLKYENTKTPGDYS